MKKSEIFATVLHYVARETEISEEQIISNKRDEETVDARYILVYVLTKCGICPSRISAFVHKDTRTINNIITHFYERVASRKYITRMLENITSLLGTNGISI